MIFVDEAKIFIKAGSGGKGCESFDRNLHISYPKPTGGNGGNGGDVVIVGKKSLHTLLDFKFNQHCQAANGTHGSSNTKRGRDGEDCILSVPVGTIIKDFDTQLIIKDMLSDQQSVVVAKGGKGGIGNAQRKLTKPPSPGEERTISLELKLVADVGLVGFPNAGKSTLISAISKVKSKIANYPFTTKQPILGIVSFADFDPSLREESNFIIADLPGIIEGAHKGKGLGHRFLRHAERTKIIVHIIDMAGSEMRDPLDDYKKINVELAKYSGTFEFKHKIIVANKMDLPEAAENLKRFKKKVKGKIISISALEKKGLDEFINTVREHLCKENSQDK